jgi:ABC-2 type transport system permease protein
MNTAPQRSDATGQLFGTSDVSPWLSLGIVTTSLLVVCGLCLRLLQSGYKIRH